MATCAIAALFVWLPSKRDSGRAVTNVGSSRPSVESTSGERPADSTASSGVASNPIDETLPPPSAQTATLTVFVQDDAGQPLDRFSIHMCPVRAVGSSTDDRHVWNQQCLAKNGQFDLIQIPRGRWLIHAEGELASEAKEVDLSDGARIEFVVPRLAHVVGRVEDPNGKGWGTSLCLLEEQRGDSPNPARKRESRSAEDGSFDMPATPGVVHIEASAPGVWANSESIPVQLASGERSSPIRLVLRQGARIEGGALDDSGRPDHGRQVRLSGIVACDSDSPRTVIVNEEGRFAFDHLAPGDYQLTRIVRDDESRAAGTSPETDRRLVRLREVVKVTLGEGEVRGVVLGGAVGDGYRVWGNVIGSEHLEGPSFVNLELFNSLDKRFAMLDENGRYEVLLEKAGTYHITVASRVGVLLQQNTEMLGLPLQRVDLVLGDASIHGRVLAADETPVAKVQLTLSSASWDDEYPPTRPPARHTVSDAQGRYAFEALLPDTYDLTLVVPRELPVPRESIETRMEGIVVAPGARLDGFGVHVEGSGSIAADVVSNATAVPRARFLFAKGPGERSLFPSAWHFTDDQGHSQIDGIPPGAWFIRAVGLGDRASQWTGPVEVRANSKTPVSLQVVECATLIVRVSGTRTRGANVVVFDSRRFEVSRGYVQKDGEVCLSDVTYGHIQLIVSDSDAVPGDNWSRSKTLDFEITSPKPPTVAIDLGGG
jgi:protocatechuate 3,4-dioxygenase beta subunit